MTIFDLLRSVLFGVHLPTEPKTQYEEAIEDAAVIYHEKRLPENEVKPKKPRKSKVKVEGNANLLYTKEELKNIKEPE